MTSTVGSPRVRKTRKSVDENRGVKILVGLVVAIFIIVMVGAKWDQHVQKSKMTDLQAQYPGVNLELTKRRTSVTYTYTAGLTHKQCRAGIDQFADKYVINVNHQRGVCRKALVEASKKAESP